MRHSTKVACLQAEGRCPGREQADTLILGLQPLGPQGSRCLLAPRTPRVLLCGAASSLAACVQEVKVKGSSLGNHLLRRKDQQTPTNAGSQQSQQVPAVIRTEPVETATGTKRLSASRGLSRKCQWAVPNHQAGEESFWA